MLSSPTIVTGRMFTQVIAYICNHSNLPLPARVIGGATLPSGQSMGLDTLIPTVASGWKRSLKAFRHSGRQPGILPYVSLNQLTQMQFSIEHAMLLQTGCA